MPHAHATACPECDLLITLGDVPNRHNALCPRCGYVVFESRPDSVERALALSTAGLILFLPAVLLPLMTLEKLGLKSAGNVFEGIFRLWEEGYVVVAVMVLICAILAPLLDMLLMFTLSLHLRLGRRPPYLANLLRVVHQVREWAMLEVLMMGVLVSMVKLADMAHLVIGPGLYCTVGLLLCAVCMQWLVNEHELWQVLDAPGK